MAARVGVPAQRLRGASAPAPPPSDQAYVADFMQEAPHRLSWSSHWANLEDPDDANKVGLRFTVLDLAPGLELYVASKSDDFQSPTSRWELQPSAYGLRYCRAIGSISRLRSDGAGRNA